MYSNAKTFKTVFLTTAYLDRTGNFPQNYEAIFVNFNYFKIHRKKKTVLGHADLKNGSCHFIVFEFEVFFIF